MTDSAKKISPTRIATYVALSVALTVVGAIIKIPFALPMTLQFGVVALIVFLLGEYSAISLAVYIIMGLCGLPIFANGGGISYLLQPSFGFVLGFLMACYPCGKILNPLPCGNRPSIKRKITALVLFLTVVYLVGAIYFTLIQRFYLASDTSIFSLLALAVFPTLWKDLLLCLLVLSIGGRLQSLVGLKK